MKRSTTVILFAIIVVTIAIGFGSSYRAENTKLKAELSRAKSEVEATGIEATRIKMESEDAIRKLEKSIAKLTAEVAQAKATAQGAILTAEVESYFRAHPEHVPQKRLSSEIRIQEDQPATKAQN